jgi:hypothetical protein
MEFKVICINDSDRPDGIPTSKWVKRGNIYTVIKVSVMNIQGRVLGFKLKELNIDDCFPFQYFLASRFAIVVPEKDEIDEYLENILKEAEKEHSLLQDLDV